MTTTKIKHTFNSHNATPETIPQVVFETSSSYNNPDLSTYYTDRYWVNDDNGHVEYSFSIEHHPGDIDGEYYLIMTVVTQDNRAKNLLRDYYAIGVWSSLSSERELTMKQITKFTQFALTSIIMNYGSLSCLPFCEIFEF